MDEYALAPRVWREVKPNPVLDVAEKVFASATNAIFGVSSVACDMPISPLTTIHSPQNQFSYAAGSVPCIQRFKFVRACSVFHRQHKCSAALDFPPPACHFGELRCIASFTIRSSKIFVLISQASNVDRELMHVCPFRCTG